MSGSKDRREPSKGFGPFIPDTGNVNAPSEADLIHPENHAPRSGIAEDAWSIARMRSAIDRITFAGREPEAAWQGLLHIEEGKDNPLRRPARRMSHVMDRAGGDAVILLSRMGVRPTGEYPQETNNG